MEGRGGGDGAPSASLRLCFGLAQTALRGECGLRKSPSSQSPGREGPGGCWSSELLGVHIGLSWGSHRVVLSFLSAAVGWMGPALGQRAVLGVGEGRPVWFHPWNLLAWRARPQLGQSLPSPHLLSLLSTGEMPFPTPGSTSSRSRWMRRSSRGAWRDRLSEGHELRVASPGH